jgi:NhaP-type Na+/H+ or K+/H+ antiporter
VLNVEFILLLLFFAALSGAAAPRLGIPVELLLLLLTITVSLIPGLPHIAIRPEDVFYLILPPILFAAAYFTSWHDFKRNLRPIALMAIGLVIFTVLGVGYIVHFFFPFIPLPVAFVLGAVISPPDASAATALAKKIGLPRRVITILEGESLLNDATALVCFKFAVAAVMTGTFSLALAAQQFLIVALGGALVGLLLGSAMIALIRVLNSTTSESLLSFVCCFAAYSIAESLHVSGVVSTVCAGLIFGRSIPKVVSAETRLEAGGGVECSTARC